MMVTSRFTGLWRHREFLKYWTASAISDVGSQVTALALPLIGEDNIIWGADYPHPDCLWPDSRKILDKNLGGFSERVRRKITGGNVATLYRI